MIHDFYKIKKDFDRRGLFFCFNGPISQALLVGMGETLKKKMKLAEASTSTVLRVFSMLVEQAQNIIHYSAEEFPSEASVEKKEKLRLGLIAVGHEKGHYFVLCGNMIRSTDVEKLNGHLTKIRMMTKSELKAHYKEQRRRPAEDGGKGAGLGFLEMAKKASEPIQFEFEKIDEEFSFFSIKTTI
ncbi:MAG: hypothetical protein GY859_04395 [Desulfobacterales bacterium]|nr:hypothetical protein [Desulfobacterales bacterium]